MAKRKILLCLAHMSGNEMKYIEEAMADCWVAPLGPNVNGFESDLEQFVGENKRVVALASGTAAVHLALVALGVGPGDEVICQSFTFCASCNPVLYQGATPVFVDSEPDTYNLDPELLDKAIADRIAVTGRKPKAIIPVCLYGMPPKMKEIMAVANKYDIPVVEDSAEGFGSRYQSQMCGTFGKFGVLSFNGNKMITTSGGGALICDDKATMDRIMFYATQARESYPYYQHELLGYNYRMSNICAGIGRGQMSVVDKHISHHHHTAAYYKEAFKDVEGITFHENPSEEFDSNYWLSVITLSPDLKVKGQEKAYSKVENAAIGGAGSVVHLSKSPHTAVEPNANVEAMRVALAEEGIESRPFWKPMHLQPLYANAPSYLNGVSESLFKVGLCLPSGPWVSDEDLALIVKTIKDNIVR